MCEKSRYPARLTDRGESAMAAIWLGLRECACIHTHSLLYKDRGGEGNHCVREDHTSSKVPFLAHRELKEILTRLGVLRWRFLDVGISRYASLKFWPEVRGFLGEIQWFWELEIVSVRVACAWPRVLPCTRWCVAARGWMKNYFKNMGTILRLCETYLKDERSQARHGGYDPASFQF
ncbi:uncharacterized protein LOC126587017 [Malus sylvestris]|uniref:uncharacterized protein LOC126587017 n=1 Tax=Malus sylvestris TaxID=3752 RepID=UPI0021ABEE35|nr:uncharacterized protein LOC126587017 [Malus sylvestris]